MIEETLELAGREISFLRPPSADELIDESAFDEDEFLPYWAELWPSGIALARAVAALELAGARVLELGAGLGLPSLAAALGGAEVLATDWADDAVALAPRECASGTGSRCAPRSSAGTSRSRCCRRRRGGSCSARICSTSGATPTSCWSCCRGSAATCCSRIRGGRSRRASSTAPQRDWEIDTERDGTVALHRLRLR